MDIQSFFESFGRLFSRKQVKDIETHLVSAGVDVSGEAFAGYFFLNIIVLTAIITFAVVYVPSIHGAVYDTIKSFLPFMYEEAITIIVFFAALLAVYFMLFALVSSALVVGAETRRNAVEAALPDFLTLVSANVKAGMTLDQAMWYAAKPEFGLLSAEVKVVIKRAFSGESLSGALDELAVRVDSKVFQRTISLIKQASATGGEIAEILERTAQDTRNSSIMKKDISASLVLYEIFVLFAAIFGTPFLFAVSSKLIGVLEKAFAYLPQTGGQSVSQFSFIKPMVPTITSGQFFWFSIVTIAVTAVFASFIVGVIRTGSRTEGLKYLPFVLALALGVFWVVTQALNAFFITLT